KASSIWHKRSPKTPGVNVPPVLHMRLVGRSIQPVSNSFVLQRYCSFCWATLVVLAVASWLCAVMPVSKVPQISQLCSIFCLATWFDLQRSSCWGLHVVCACAWLVRAVHSYPSAAITADRLPPFPIPYPRNPLVLSRPHPPSRKNTLPTE